MFNCTEADVWGNPYTFLCSYGCCGSSSFRYCCSSNGNSYIPTPWQPDIPGAVIAGVTAGCVLGVVVIVGVVYALCRHAKKKDRFVEQAINRLRVPQGKATHQVSVTTKMYPGPWSGVKLLTTYIPRHSPQLTSTPVGDHAVASQKPQKQRKSKGKGAASSGKTPTRKTQKRIDNTTPSVINRKTRTEATTPGQVGGEKTKIKTKGQDGRKNVKTHNTKETKPTTNFKTSPDQKRKNQISL